MSGDKGQARIAFGHQRQKNVLQPVQKGIIYLNNTTECLYLVIAHLLIISGQNVIHLLVNGPGVKGDTG